MAESDSNNAITNGLYDALMFIAQIVLPAVATLYLTISETWGLPHGPEISGTVMAVDAFLGLMLRALRTAYYKNDGNFAGTVVVQEQPNASPDLMLQLDSKQALEDLPGKHSVQFNVKKVPS